MHEHSLIKNLIEKAKDITLKQGGGKILSLKIKLGALSHISETHFREHFNNETPGTVLDGAILNVEEQRDTSDPLAQEIILESVEFEEVND